MSHRPRGLEDDTPAAPGEVPQLKDLFGAILQQAIDGFWVVDLKGRFLEVNAAYCELVGYSREELLRRSITDIEAAESQVQTAEHIARVRATGGDRFLTKHRRKDGTIVDVEISAQYMEQAGGFVFVFVRDVTGREREVELQQTARHGLQRKIDERDAEAALLRNTIEQLPLSVVLTDTDGRIEYVNPAFTRITGYAPVEVIGSTPRVLKSGAQRAPVYDQLWTAIKAGRQWQGEFINRRKDGTTYAQELLIAPVHDRQSGTVRLVGIGQDVTERNQLRDSLELTQFSLDHSTDAVLWVDAQGRVTYASLGASRLLGYTREELLTRSIWELSSQLSAQSWPQRWAQTSHAGFWRGEDEARRKDGSSVATEVVVTHVRFGGKEIQCAILRDLTERNRASQALRESARTMAEAERIGHFGSYRLDVAAGTWTSSAGLDEIFGISGASISRDIPGWLSFVHPEQRQELADYIAQEVLGKGRAFDHEYRIVRSADGEVRWVHGLGTVLTDRDSHPVELFGTVQDITDDKREGALLQESVELNRRMLASSVFGTLIYDGLSGECLVANDAAARVVGASVGQLSTQTFRRLASWKDSGLLAAAESVLQSGVSLRKTFVVCPSLGKDVVLDCFLAVFETERRPRLLLIFEDVTAYRAAEEALRKSEARHRALVRALPDLVVVLDRCGVVLDYHGPNATWLLASAGQCLGRTFHEVLPAEVAREIDVAIAASLATKKVISVKHKLAVASGVGTYEARVLCAEDDNVYLVIRDVTEQSRMEEQLFISDRMASIGTLAAGVAHEINNPLAALMANLTFAVEDVTKLAQDLHAPDPGAHSTGAGSEGSNQWISARLRAIDEPLQDARESAERVRHIVRDLKIFSRSDEEKTGAVDVRAVMESSLRMAWNEIRHRARLVKDYAEVPWVEANEGRLGQVFLNLIVNAAQAMPEGRADHNEIRVVTKQDEHGRVVVEVRDTGSGIAESMIPRIFDPFFTTKPIGEGTGLGLAICQRIVTALGGELSVESQLGKGSVFRTILPVANDQAAQASPTPPTAVAGRRGRILVIDDEPMLGKAVHRMLSRDHEVLTETTARAAIERVSKGERFDLMLCDLMMPELTGMDLHAELLRIAPEQAQKMVFMTGGAFTSRAREFLEEVRNPRIDKPLDVDKVRALVRGLLG